LLVDTHCHLNFENFNPDRDLVVDRARQARLSRILNPGVDLKSCRSAIKLAETYPEVYAAVGVHPNDALLWDDSTLSDLSELAGQPKVVAIGEIGLDYYRDRAPRDVQRRVFQHQLELAAEVHLPVILHLRNSSAQDRSATLDMLGILVEWCSVLIAAEPDLAERPGVLHSFSGNLTEARQALDLNFWIGVSGPVTFRKADTLKEVVANLPLERLLIETDAPFLTPHPHRSERNEPAHVLLVAQEIAHIRNLPFEEVAGISSSNAGQLFRW
jgi:TatD DNase family protein